jgi:hypothetical protein
MTIREQREAQRTLREDIEAAINRHNRENRSGTPDFILAECVLAALDSIEAAIIARDAWFSFTPMIGGTVPAVDPEYRLKAEEG